MDNSEEIRPYWSEPAEVLSGPSLAPRDTRRRVTMDEANDERIAALIADRICPWCGHDLDDDLYCATCGKTATERLPRVWTPEKKDDYVPTLPLPFDEFAPADTGEAL